jgi:hypothetical protein
MGTESSQYLSFFLFKMGPEIELDSYGMKTTFSLQVYRSSIRNNLHFTHFNNWNHEQKQQVEEMKALLWLLPTWATTLAVNIVCIQILNFASQQASTIDRNGKFYSLEENQTNKPKRPKFFIQLPLLYTSILETRVGFRILRLQMLHF